MKLVSGFCLTHVFHASDTIRTGIKPTYPFAENVSSYARAQKQSTATAQLAPLTLSHFNYANLLVDSKCGPEGGGGCCLLMLMLSMMFMDVFGCSWMFMDVVDEVDDVNGRCW